MLDISGLSRRYAVRRMTDADADAILALCLQNTRFYDCCGQQPSRELVLNDLHMTPPGMDETSKYYVGFYDDSILVAVMDLIDGYPDPGTAFIGFFMMNRTLQGQGTGTAIVGEVCRYLKESGFTAARLAIDKGNPQSTHFWRKNGFIAVSEVDRDGWTVLVAERRLV